MLKKRQKNWLKSEKQTNKQMNCEKTRIGYNPSSLFGSLDVIKFARSADHFVKADSIWMPESWGREAFVMLGAISQVTNRIKLGTSIISIFARSPATTSMARFHLRYHLV